MADNFFTHIHARQVSRDSLRPTATLGLGIVCLTCLGVLLATGLTLFLSYVAQPEQAYESILHVTTTLRFGRVVRNLHFLAANLLIFAAVLHLARVALTGSYRGRWLNWIYGLLLLLCLMAANFTGYLLPWDQVSYWAVKVGATLATYIPLVGEGLRSFLLGGEDIGPETLPRALALHAGLLPHLMLLLAGLHLWRLRKDGGLAAGAAGDGERLPARPWLYLAEGGVAFATLALLLVLAVLVDAPIYERANPSHPPNPAKAPWYFVGVQEMVSHSALIGGVIVPLSLLAFLCLLPVLDRSRVPGGVWFAPGRRLLAVILIVLLLSQAAFIVIGVWFRGPNWTLRMPF